MLTSIVGVIKNKVYLNGLRLQNYTSAEEPVNRGRISYGRGK